MKAALDLMNGVCGANEAGPNIYLKNYNKYQPLLQVRSLQSQNW